MRLPAFKSAEGKRRVAAQSELLALDENHFLVLCRDTGNGYGVEGTTSLYRRIELLDTAEATNIAGTKYDGLTSVAPKGRLADDVVAAATQPFIDINDNAEPAKFGLHNGPPQDRNNLGEKWEAMGLVPALDPTHPRDFITQHGFHAGQAYADASGADLDTMILVYRITRPSPPK